MKTNTEIHENQHRNITKLFWVPQFRKGGALEWKALVVGDVPMKNVEFVERHRL